MGSMARRLGACRADRERQQPRPLPPHFTSYSSRGFSLMTRDHGNESLTLPRSLSIGVNCPQGLTRDSLTVAPRVVSGSQRIVYFNRILTDDVGTDVVLEGCLTSVIMMMSARTALVGSSRPTPRLASASYASLGATPACGCMPMLPG